MKKISNIRYHIIPSESTNHDTFFADFAGVGPIFSSFSPYPSFATNDRKHFKCLHKVLNNKNSTIIFEI